MAAYGLACASGTEPSPRLTEDPSTATQATDWSVSAHARLPMLAPCQRAGIDETLLCGTLPVPEDRTQRGGRQITLEIVVVPARQDAPPNDPVFVFEGGPGGAATQRAGGSIYAGPVRQRDIVLVDQRGTGGSNPLDCDLEITRSRAADKADGRSLGTVREMFPPAAISACLDRLSQHADVTRYTSLDHADDIEAVRQALGYGPINLRGGSYGTRAMMVYAQRYPSRTRTLFGIGVDSPLRSNLAERGAMAERSLTGISRLCKADVACAALLPDLEQAVRALLGSLDDSPRTVTLRDPNDPTAPLTLAVGRAWLAENVRLLLYFAFTSRALPWAIHQAHTADDWAPLTTLAVLIERMFQSSLATGMALTVQCSEHMDFDVAQALADGVQTLFGSDRLAQQVQGCAAWRYTKHPPLGRAEPVALDIPTLLLSGELDAVTPPTYAEDARALFPNSAHVVIEGGQHGPFDLEGAWTCVHQMWADLLDAGTVDSLDTACATHLTRPSFLVDAESFDSHVAEALAPQVSE